MLPGGEIVNSLQRSFQNFLKPTKSLRCVIFSSESLMKDFCGFYVLDGQYQTITQCLFHSYIAAYHISISLNPSISEPTWQVLFRMRIYKRQLHFKSMDKWSTVSA